MILDVELSEGGTFTTPVPSDWHGFAYMLDGEAIFGGNRQLARPPQLVLLGPGEVLTAVGSGPSSRFMLFAGKPYGEVPRFNGPFVD